MKIFISGPISKSPDYKEKFRAIEDRLREEGHDVMSPAILPESGFAHEEYLHITKAMIDVCDAIYWLPDWQTSKGCMEEMFHAAGRKVMIFGDRDV